MELVLLKYADRKLLHGVQRLVNAKSSRGETALIVAASQGHEEAFRLLITNGADLDAISRDGLTTLDFAAEGSYQNIAEFLIRHGADVERAELYTEIRRRNITVANNNR